MNWEVLAFYTATIKYGESFKEIFRLYLLPAEHLYVTKKNFCLAVVLLQSQEQPSIYLFTGQSTGEQP